MQRDRDLLAADVFIGLDGPRQTTFMPEIKLGARGGVAFDLVVRLRDHAHHSGHWGGVLADPGFILAHALADHRHAAGPHPRERAGCPRRCPTACCEATRAIVFEDMPGLPEADPDWGEPGLTKSEKIFAWTSVIMLAQITGHPDAPTNAVQGEARARLQVRHTVDVPARRSSPRCAPIWTRLASRMVEVVPVMERDMFAASRTDPADPWVGMVAGSMARTANRAPNVIPNSSGSNPSEIFAEELGVPVIWVPNSYAGCNQHGPDEHALAPLLREGLGLMAGIWWDIGAGLHPPPKQ